MDIEMSYHGLFGVQKAALRPLAQCGHANAIPHLYPRLRAEHLALGLAVEQERIVAEAELDFEATGGRLLPVRGRPGPPPRLVVVQHVHVL